MIEAELSSVDDRAGFRLRRLEVLNWGTFDEHVWFIEPNGAYSLLTGDIGSGKSTLVDAITTLLVPPHKVAYNKAAEADKFERSLKTYVLGHYKALKGPEGLASKPIALRTHDDYSVVLATFHDAPNDRHVTLAQVFWWKNPQGQPERLFVVADEPLTITQHFSAFSEIGELRKRLKRERLKGLLVEENYPPYATAFRQRLGIPGQQALDLFHQTVSMKSVSNLTDFVRKHMLEPSDVDARIKELIGHFEALSQAHDLVLTAKTKIERLEPIVADCTRYSADSHEIERWRACHEALPAWFAAQRHVLLAVWLQELTASIRLLTSKIQALDARRVELSAARDEVKQAISLQGGDRLERIKAEIVQHQREGAKRRERATKYDALARAVALPVSSDQDTFLASRQALEGTIADAEARESRLANQQSELAVETHQLRQRYAELERELESLRRRKSNIPASMLAIREALCAELGTDENTLPFVGELIQVRPEAHEWEGAAERVLQGFALAVLVADAHYERAAGWVDRTNLKGRLVYYQVRDARPRAPRVDARSLVKKLELKTDSEFYAWLEAELAERFDYTCCDNVEELRRQRLAVTKRGQVKKPGGRHEKDDRRRIDDRSQFVLGWTNHAKIKAIDTDARRLLGSMKECDERGSALRKQVVAVKDRVGMLKQFAMFDRFEDIDWAALEVRVGELNAEREALEANLKALAPLLARLTQLETDLVATGNERDEHLGDRRGAEENHKSAEDRLRACERLVGQASDSDRARFATLEELRAEGVAKEELPDAALTLETADQMELGMRRWVERRIHASQSALNTLRDRIVKTMKGYSTEYPVDTQEVDESVGSAGDYTAMLQRLRADDLPKYERRFKELLNENTIREVANFQWQLSMEQQTIEERVEDINRSLLGIPYNRGRYICLQTEHETDREVRDFQTELKKCTQDTLAGTADEGDTYSETKFLQVKSLIERFRGRPESPEVDRKWLRKVTDVRNWFTFAASERNLDDHSEHEHYTDSAGKSGGQKEKLAYTVLAASLVYQFGLERRTEVNPKTFRFVVIDEAFGRGSDESTRFGLELFRRLHLQLLIVTPLQKIPVIEPFVASVALVHNQDGKLSRVKNMTIEEYRELRAARALDARS